MVFLATVLWSTAGLFVRLLDLDSWTVLGWRSVFAALALGVIVFWQRRQADAATNSSLPITLLTIPIAVVSMAAYVVSLKLTTVANVMVVYATVPLIAAGLAWIFLRETPHAQVLVASGLALVGVVVMVGGAALTADLAGMAVALLMTLAMGGQIVLARKFPTLDMAMINMVAAAICALLGLSLSAWQIPDAADLVILFLFGVSNTALAYYFVLRGARVVASAEVGLISTLDVVLGPLWVWLLVQEVPGGSTVAGGVIVFAAVVGYLWMQRSKSHGSPT